MVKSQSDLVVWHKLETEFFQNHVSHTRYVEKAKNRNEKIKEDWRNCEELGRGGFGVVSKQIQRTTGHYRAVKTIHKMRLPPDLDYSREILAMAILSKRPSLFVKFLGWFEELEALHIAMEYLEEGDLTKHIGGPLPEETVRNISKQILEGLEVMHQHGIAHRDLKPANIFVVSMSPVWVKLGDFGISKRVQAQDTTTFHTQVSTPVYSAPEVLGLDSNSETSDYTNSVDIWSLGCVIYELLVGAKLFDTEVQVTCYYFGKFPFPEDKLKGLSPPTSDAGILFLESMLVVQPEDRPTAKDSLRHEWLVGLGSSDVDGGDDQDETTEAGDESTWNRKSRDMLATDDEPKERSCERNSIAQDNTKHAQADVILGASPHSESGGDRNLWKSATGTSVVIPPDLASIEGSPIQTEHLDPQSIPDNSRVIGSASKGGRALRGKRIHIQSTWPSVLPQAIPQRRQTFAAEIVSNRPPGPMASLNTPQSTNPPLTSPMEPLQKLPTGGSGSAGSGQLDLKLQRTKSSRIQPPKLGVGEIAETETAHPSVQRKILIFAGILMLAGILGRSIIIAGSPTPGGMEISDGTPFTDGIRTATR